MEWRSRGRVVERSSDSGSRGIGTAPGHCTEEAIQARASAHQVAAQSGGEARNSTPSKSQPTPENLAARSRCGKPVDNLLKSKGSAGFVQNYQQVIHRFSTGFPPNSTNLMKMSHFHNVLVRATLRYPCFIRR